MTEPKLTIDEDEELGVFVNLEVGNQVISIKASVFESLYNDYKRKKDEYIERKFRSEPKPPYIDCVPFSYDNCSECSDLYVCDFHLAQIMCPKCSSKGMVLRACEESGWNYVCESCGHPFDDPK